MQEKQTQNKKQEQNTLQEMTFSYSGICVEWWNSLLLAIFSAIITILSTNYTQEQQGTTVYIVYIGILVVLYSVIVNGIWGVFTAFVSSVLFCVTVKTSLEAGIINVIANSIQALLIWMFLKNENIKSMFKKPGKTINGYRCFLFWGGIAYVIVGILYNKIEATACFCLAVTGVTIYESIKNREKGYAYFILLICLIPSTVGAILNSVSYIANNDYSNILQSIITWTCSNYVLYSFGGFLLLSFVVPNKHSVSWRYDGTLKMSTVLFYIATLIWNALIYGMYLLEWLKPNTIFYLIPWAVGNVFFVANMNMSKKPEITSNTEDAFKWFENRAIVAENNTQMLIAVISFLLPISAQYIGTITRSLAIVFMLNITAAIISIGLIWVPKTEIRIMETIKNIKTICHLFTLSLLLLAIFMIVNK